VDHLPPIVVLRSARERLRLGLLALALALAAASRLIVPGAIAVADEPVRPSASQELTKLPVILLTGFEPFGAERPRNPSWEGIKLLDGQRWQGYQLIAKQMRVDWGAPLEQLRPWIEQYHPAAIFSFGMGAKGRFTIETLARKRRGRSRDNHDAYPPTREIVPDGPERFRSELPSCDLAEALGQKGFDTLVSVNAGRYLCEETLYTLEYLKSQGQVPGTVMFCHVPPLGTEAGRKIVTAGHVQRFAMAVLEAWSDLYLAQAKSATAEPPRPRAANADTSAADPRTAQVKELITRYFLTWSSQDMRGYNDCFLPDAAIQFIDPRGAVTTTLRQQFIEAQRDVHLRSPQRMVEVPESIDVRFEEKLARAVVAWKLTAGTRIDRGYDHFTLARIDGRWKIVNLVFYSTASTE
jgi:pyrrolidone-carboxylate peptidase